MLSFCCTFSFTFTAVSSEFDDTDNFDMLFDLPLSFTSNCDNVMRRFVWQ